MSTSPDGEVKMPLHFFDLLTAHPVLNLGSSSVLIILVGILLLITAMVAGAEVAFFSLKAKDINYIKNKNTGSFKTILNLLENPQKLLATLLIANSFLSIGIIITTNIIVNSLFDFSRIFPSLSPDFSSIINVLIQVVIVTFFLVLFGEVLPKVYATQNNMRMSLLCAPLVSFFNKIFSPFSNVLVNSTAFIEKKLNATNKHEISNEDVEHAIEITVGHSASKEEVNIFKGILNFSETTARQIMRPRMDVSGIDFNSNFEQVQQQVLECGYSRIPIYVDTLDTIKGILHTKDLLVYLDNTKVDWHTIIRPTFFVPESKFIEDLLREFQQKRIHFAVVVDEFGGTSGIVTLEDIMEEIIGDIKDEFDEEENEIKKIADNTFICEGKILINDMCRGIGEPYDTFDDARGDSDSLAGLLLELNGKFPLKGEMIQFKNYNFTTIEIEKNRIKKVKLEILPEVQIEN